MKRTISAVSLNHPQSIPPSFHGKLSSTKPVHGAKKGWGLLAYRKRAAAPVPAYDFRATPAESQGAMTRNMTKDEVIEKLKSCIRQQDPAFRKRFLDFTKEPNGKIHTHDFKKVGGQGFSALLPFLKEVQLSCRACYQALKAQALSFFQSGFIPGQNGFISRHLPTM